MASRTTLALDDDILSAARACAERQRRTIGEVVSDWARKGLSGDRPSYRTRNGIRILPRRGAVVTMELVNALRDEEE